MDPLAAQLAALRLQIQDREDALNPCRVRIDGGPWIGASTVSSRASELSLALGGTQEIRPQVFRLRKSLVPASPRPAKTLIECDNGITYRVESVDGDAATSPAWLVTCQKFSK